MLNALLASAVVTFSLPAPPKVEIERMLDAIKQAENWDGKTMGAAGEWGPFQFLPSVWVKTIIGKRKTMQKATPSEHRTAAREELLFRIATLQINHREPTAYVCGLLWGAGVDATLKGTASDFKRDYARRVANCYEAAGKR